MGQPTTECSLTSPSPKWIRNSSASNGPKRVWVSLVRQTVRGKAVAGEQGRVQGLMIWSNGALRDRVVTISGAVNNGQRVSPWPAPGSRVPLGRLQSSLPGSEWKRIPR